MVGVIYSADSEGNPDQLLAKTEPVGFSKTAPMGFVRLPFSPAVVIAGEKYTLTEIAIRFGCNNCYLHHSVSTTNC